MSTNYSEQIFQSIDTIISQRLNEVSFDKTEICEIISQDKNDKRKYLVSNGSLKYEAYSDDENRSYLNNQKVYVRITNGDYSLRKIITGSYAADETNENLYVNPFNHLVTSSTLPLPSSIWAKVNDEEYDDWDDVPSDSTKPNSVEFPINFNYKNTQDFDYIGLDFSFKTNIVGYQGSYALKISLWNNETNLTKDDNTLILSSKNLYGNPYNLNSSLSFQHLFPWPTRKKDDKIERIPITEITKIKLQLIQDNNFLKQQGEINVNTDTWIELTKADLKFGYDVKNIIKDELQLILEEGQSLKYTTGQTTTGESTTGETTAARNLYLDWKHFDTSNTPYIFNIHQSPNIFEEYAVYWLHYVDGLGENVDLPDEYAWNWETINFIDLETDQYLKKIIKLTTQFRTDQYKVVIKYTTNKFTEEQQTNIDKFNKLKSEYKQLLLNLKNPNLTEEEKINKKTRLAEIRENKELVNSYYTYTESTGLVFDNTDVAADPGASNSSEDSLRIKLLNESDTGVYNIYGLDGRMMDYSYRGPHNIYFEFLDTTPLDRIASINWEFPSENTMIKDVVDTDKQKATFNIDTMYKPGAMNNRIWCTVTLVTGEIRRGSLTLQFGEAAAAGSNYAFNIDFIGHRTCLYATGKEDSVEVQAIFTKQNGEVLTIPTITWSWMNDYNSPITLSSSTGEKITLTYNNSKVPKENYSILQAKINDYAIDNGLTTNLTAYLPIPIAKPEYNYISGATRVVYDSNGNTATYSRNPYELYNLTNKIEDTSWNIISNSTNDTFQLKTYSIRDKNGNIIGEEKTLLPLSYIPQEPPMTCIYCILNENIVWSQPILIIQNRWEYDLLNEWNGKLNINDQQGYMLAPLLGAGKKEDNGFTGVIMGDLKLAKGSVTNTGLYGFKDGSRRFSFNDKGEAYIGTGDNYIEFDNTNLIINVQNFDLNANYMKISSTDKIINIYKGQSNLDNDLRVKLGLIKNSTYGLDIYEGAIRLYGVPYSPNLTDSNAAIYFNSNTMYLNGLVSRSATNEETYQYDWNLDGEDIDSVYIYNNTSTLLGEQALSINIDSNSAIRENWFSGISFKTIFKNTNKSSLPTNTYLGITGGRSEGYLTQIPMPPPFLMFTTGTKNIRQFIATTSSTSGDSHNAVILASSITPELNISTWGSPNDKAIKVGSLSVFAQRIGTSYYSGVNIHGTLYTDDTTSDVRRKHSIEPLEEQYEIFFDNLLPKRYKYINGTSNRYHTGFIAQEVLSSLEKANLTSQEFAGVMLLQPAPGEEECYHLRKDEFIALNTWQIQKLKTRVTELENEIKEIKQRYEI